MPPPPASGVQAITSRCAAALAATSTACEYAASASGDIPTVWTDVSRTFTSQGYVTIAAFADAPDASSAASLTLHAASVTRVTGTIVLIR